MIWARRVSAPTRSARKMKAAGGVERAGETRVAGAFWRREEARR